MMADSLTSTPALAAAMTAANGAPDLALGYSIAYPVGVIVTMILVTIVARKPLPGKRDPDPKGPTEVQAITVRVERPLKVSQIPGSVSIIGKDSGEVRATYMQRGDEMKVAHSNEQLRVDDRIALMATPEALTQVEAALGTRMAEHLGDHRTEVDHRRFVVSDPDILGTTVADLHIPLRFECIICEIRCGDVNMIPSAETTLEAGNRVVAVAPRKQMGDIADFFGNSENKSPRSTFSPWAWALPGAWQSGSFRSP